MAVALTGVVGMIAPASAALRPDIYQGAGKIMYNFYTQGSHRDNWAGAYEAISGISGAAGTGVAWCIEAGPNPSTGSAAASKVSNSARMAYVLYAHEAKNTEASRAQISYLMHKHHDSGDVYTNGMNERARWMSVFEAQYPALVTAADQWWADAASKAGPYTTKPLLTVDPSGAKGTVGEIGVKGTSGAFVAGFPYTLTLTGPATFSNGTKTITGTTGSSAANRAITVTGNGEVRAQLRVDVPADHMLTYKVGDLQRMAVQAARSTINGATATHPVFIDFQPEVTTQVASKFIKAGDGFADRVTARAAAGDTWYVNVAAGAHVPVKATGTLYGPYASPQTPRTTVPAGAPVVGTATLTFDGPGTKTAGADIKATGSGYYTWVWDIKKSEQGSNSQYIRGNYSDGFFTVGETSIVQMQPKVRTEVSSAFITQGDAFGDQVTAFVDPGSLWLTDESGRALDVKAEGTLYGPYASPQTSRETVPANAPVVGTDTVSFTAPGTKTAGLGLEAAASGYYTWVWDINKASQSDTVRPFIEGDFTDGFFTAGETTIVQMQPKVRTEVSNVFIGKGDAFGDQVTAFVDPGSLWLTDESGRALDVKAEGTLYGPYASPQTSRETVPANAPVVGTDTVSFTAPGTKTAGLGLEAAASGYYTWVWDINKASQSDTVRPFIEGDFTDGFFTAGETTIVQTYPQITTERDSKIVDRGSALIDAVTVSLPDGDLWLTDETGDPLAFSATGTAYGPFNVPLAQSQSVPAGAPIAGTEDLVFTQAGTQRTSGAVTATGPGFYTWVWEITAQDQESAVAPYLGADFRDDFMIEVETSSVLHDIEHTSLVREYNVAPGGRAFDTITISGLPADHGQFEGLGGWVADGALADVTVYGPMVEAPSTVEVPHDAPVFSSTQIPATNGVFNVGYTDQDIVSPTEPGHYVFVYSFDGDDRVGAFSSDFNDVLERFYVPEQTEQRLPVEVVTQATREVLVGQDFFDTALVTGNTLEGDYLVFEAFGPQDPDEEPVCLDPFFTSEQIPVDGSGYYTSGVTSVESPGNVYWVETLYDAQDTVRHTGKCGIESETTRIVEEPVDELWVQTKAMSEEETPVVGDDIWDTVKVGGTIPEGAYTEVDLFFVESVTELVCTEPIWTSERIELDQDTSEYATNRYTTNEAGTYSFLERTFTQDGELLSEGVCGDPDETITVIPVAGGGGGQDEATPEAAGGGGGLPVTGANALGLVLGAGALLGGGIGVRRFAVKRREQVVTTSL